MINLSVIVPFYNEEDGIEHFFTTLLPLLDATQKTYEIICINDGSSDHTLAKLIEKRAANPAIKIIDFSRNFGKEAALSAGLNLAKGDAIIPIDADLQDPPELIHQMIAEWEKGFEIVLAQRINRDKETRMKRFTAYLFYKLQRKLATIPMPENVGDFQLLDKKVVAVLKQMPERQRYMKGLFSWAGFKKTIVPYERSSRHAGHTKWNYWKLWNFALDAITSFSTLPIRIWTYIGILVSSFAFIYAAIIIIKTLVFGRNMPGYASIMVTLLFMSGLQFISLGIIGEYLGRIFIETKQRPLYVVREVYE